VPTRRLLTSHKKPISVGTCGALDTAVSVVRRSSIRDIATHESGFDGALVVLMEYRFPLIVSSPTDASASIVAAAKEDDTKAAAAAFDASARSKSNAKGCFMGNSAVPNELGIRQSLATPILSVSATTVRRVDETPDSRSTSPDSVLSS
jgi:hypothetical protein